MIGSVKNLFAGVAAIAGGGGSTITSPEARNAAEAIVKYTHDIQDIQDLLTTGTHYELCEKIHMEYMSFAKSEADNDGFYHISSFEADHDGRGVIIIGTAHVELKGLCEK